MFNHKSLNQLENYIEPKHPIACSRSSIVWFALVAVVVNVISFSQLRACSSSVWMDKISDECQDEEWVEGRILNQANRPIVAASVSISIYQPVPGGVGPTAELKKIETTTNEDGRYRFALSDVPPTTNPFFIAVSASTKTCWERRRSFHEREFTDTNLLPSLRLEEGRTVRGKLVPSDTSPFSLQSPKLLAYALVRDGGSMTPFVKLFDIEENGEFECLLPPDCAVAIAATANGYAVARAKLDNSETEVGEIQLSKGVAVKGFLRDRNNKPLSNVVIHLIENEGLFLENSMMIIRSSVTTDIKGRFRFPVHSGKCTISVGHRGGNTFGKAVFPDPRKQPLVLPVILELDSDNPPSGIVLSEAEPQYLSGRILLESGEPAIGIVVDALLDGSQRVARTATDSDGKYKTAIPKAADRFGLRVVGKRDKGGDMLFGIPADHPQSTRSSTQSIRFENVDDDISDINWTLQPDRE